MFRFDQNLRRFILYLSFRYYHVVKKMVSYSEVQPYDKILGDKLTPAFARYLEEELSYIKSAVSKDARVLEVGCGAGRVIKELAPLVLEIVGTDHSFAQVEAADRILNKYKNVKIVFCDGRNIPTPDAYFDLTFSAFNTFGNLCYDKFRVLLEMRRVTKGRVLLSVYGENADTYQKELYDNIGIKSRSIGDFTLYEFPDGGNGMAERFSERKLRRLFRDSSFSDSNIEIVRIGEFGYMCDLSI